MHLFIAAYAFLPFVSLVSAGSCYGQACAETIVAEYAAVIAQQSYNGTAPAVVAQKLVAPGYSEYSDSALTINGHIPIPACEPRLGQAISSSKQQFINESQNNAPFPVDTLAVYVACDVITWRWVARTLGTGQYEVNGIHVFQLNDYSQILTAWFEFNTIAAALDTGYEVMDVTDGTALTVIPQQ